MLKRSSLLKANLLSLDVQFNEKGIVLHEILTYAAQQAAITWTDLPTYLRLLIRKEGSRPEDIGSGIGNNVAIPHLRHPFITIPIVIFAISKQGIDWASFDDLPVNLIILLLFPDFMPAKSTRLECELAALLNECRQNLMSANIEDIPDLVKSWCMTDDH